MADDIKQVFAEAQAEGFDTKAIRSLIKLRKIDADTRAEDQAVLDTYSHALGMADETPHVFAAIGALAADDLGRDKLIEAFKQLVPATAEIIIKMGETPIRLYRDLEGVAHAEEMTEPVEVVERPGKKIKPGKGAVLHMVPGGKGPSKDEIKRIADDAEARSDASKTTPAEEPESTH